jgi:hypothetical protein
MTLHLIASITLLLTASIAVAIVWGVVAKAEERLIRKRKKNL